MENILIIVTISLIVTLSPFLSSISKIPVAVVEIILGVIVAYGGLLGESDLFYVIAKVGFLYLMFLAGMEVDLNKLAGSGSDFLKKAFIYLGVLYFIAISLFLYFELSFIYVVALPVMSVGMMMTLIKEFENTPPWLEFIFSVGVLGELVSILALVLMDGYLKYGFELELFGAIATLVLFIGVSIILFRVLSTIFWWYPRLKHYIMPMEDSKNRDVRFSMAFFFIMIALMLYLKLEMVLGAFLAGMFINTFFEHKKELPEKLSSFGFGFLIPVFFVYVGSTLDFELLMSKEIISGALFIMVCMILMRLVAAFIAFYKSINSFKETILIGLADSMPLSFLVAVATIGLTENMITKSEYSAFILAAMAEAIFIMVLIKGLMFYFQRGYLLKFKKGVA